MMEIDEFKRSRALHELQEAVRGLELTESQQWTLGWLCNLADYQRIEDIAMIIKLACARTASKWDRRRQQEQEDGQQDSCDFLCI